MDNETRQMRIVAIGLAGTIIFITACITAGIVYTKHLCYTNPTAVRFDAWEDTVQSDNSQFYSRWANADDKEERSQLIELRRLDLLKKMVEYQVILKLSSPTAEVGINDLIDLESIRPQLESELNQLQSLTDDLRGTDPCLPTTQR